MRQLREIKSYLIVFKSFFNGQPTFIYIALKGLKLYYLFDFGDNWLFEIPKIRKTAKLRQGIEYPSVVSDNGIKLMQYYDEDDEGC